MKMRKSQISLKSLSEAVHADLGAVYTGSGITIQVHCNFRFCHCINVSNICYTHCVLSNIFSFSVRITNPSSVCEQLFAWSGIKISATETDTSRGQNRQKITEDFTRDKLITYKPWPVRIWCLFYVKIYKKKITYFVSDNNFESRCKCT